jgi:hypothetical protein
MDSITGVSEDVAFSNRELLERFWQARGVYDETQRRLLIEMAGIALYNITFGSQSLSIAFSPINKWGFGPITLSARTLLFVALCSQTV